jgi:putative transposase
VAASGFFMLRRRPPSPRQLRLAWLTELVRTIHAGSRGTYGWRRVNAELVYGHGVVVNRKTVRKIMRLHGLHGLPGSRKLFRSKANIATTADLVERRFDRPAPDQLWVTDITEHPTGRARCTAVLGKDCASRVERNGDGHPLWLVHLQATGAGTGLGGAAGGSWHRVGWA